MRVKRSLTIKELRTVLTNHRLAHLTNGDVALIVALAQSFIDEVNIGRAEERVEK